MEHVQQARVHSIKSKASYREEVMAKTMSQREWQLMVKNE